MELPETESIIDDNGDFKGFYRYIPDGIDDDYVVWKWLLYIIRHEGNDS